MSRLTLVSPGRQTGVVSRGSLRIYLGAAVGVGKRACQLMDEGSPQVEVIKSVSSSNPGFTEDGAAQFTMIAASAYCPQHLGQHVNQAPQPAATQQPAPGTNPPPLTPGAA